LTDDRRRKFKGITLKYPHLAASFVALSIAAVILGAGVIRGRFLERRYIHLLAPYPLSSEKPGYRTPETRFSSS
jgi:hypothetical protein